MSILKLRNYQYSNSFKKELRIQLKPFNIKRSGQVGVKSKMIVFK